MKMQRFLVENIVVSNNQIKFGEKEHKNLLNQILNVFRMKVGHIFTVFDGSGTEFLVEITEISRKEIVCEIKEEKVGMRRNKKLTLCFALIRKENFELILQKCTEIGVTNFVPLLTERTIKTGWNKERMLKIVSEAVEQSGWSDMPQLQDPVKLETYISQQKKQKENLDNVCVLDFDGVQLSSVKHLISVDTIFVGPEGGFSDKERKLFKKANIKNISLGYSILRAETACISAAAIFLL